VTEHLVQRRPDEITIRVRSLLELMGYMSYGVRVPDHHIKDLFASEIHPGMQSLIPLRVEWSEERPENTHVAVRHEGTWYYIPDSDLQSKTAFGLLSYLYQMQAPKIQGAGPLITIPS
jgi:hypothetical protein